MNPEPTLSRRSALVLAGLGAASASALVAKPRQEAQRASRRLFLYHPGEAIGRGMARLAPRIGAEPHAVEADVATLWRGVLRPAWSAGGSMSVLGVSDLGLLFALHLLARGEGQDLLFHRRVDVAAAGGPQAARALLLQAASAVDGRRELEALPRAGRSDLYVWRLGARRPAGAA